jgi:hypothetical protein
MMATCRGISKLSLLASGDVASLVGLAASLKPS